MEVAQTVIIVLWRPTVEEGTLALNNHGGWGGGRGGGGSPKGPK